MFLKKKCFPLVSNISMDGSAKATLFENVILYCLSLAIWKLVIALFREIKRFLNILSAIDVLYRYFCLKSDACWCNLSKIYLKRQIISLLLRFHFFSLNISFKCLCFHVLNSIMIRKTYNKKDKSWVFSETLFTHCRFSLYLYLVVSSSHLYFHHKSCSS